MSANQLFNSISGLELMTVSAWNNTIANNGGGSSGSINTINGTANEITANTDGSICNLSLPSSVSITTLNSTTNNVQNTNTTNITINGNTFPNTLGSVGQVLSSQIGGMAWSTPTNVKTISFGSAPFLDNQIYNSAGGLNVIYDIGKTATNDGVTINSNTINLPTSATYLLNGSISFVTGIRNATGVVITVSGASDIASIYGASLTTIPSSSATGILWPICCTITTASTGTPTIYLNLDFIEATPIPSVTMSGNSIITLTRVL